jgi:hypothetical protein
MAYVQPVRFVIRVVQDNPELGAHQAVELMTHSMSQAWRLWVDLAGTVDRGYAILCAETPGPRDDAGNQDHQRVILDRHPEER